MTDADTEPETTGLLGRLLCRLGKHDRDWCETDTTPQFNWVECSRCGYVDEEYRDQYEAYQEYLSKSAEPESEPNA